MTTPTVNASDDLNKTLDGHNIAVMADHVNHWDEKTRNLIKVIDADIEFSAPGMTISDQSMGEAGFKSIARANRFADHTNHRLKKGKRQANFAEYENPVEYGAAEDVEVMVSPEHAHNKEMGKARNDFRDSFIMQNMFASMLEAVDDATDADKFNMLHKMQTVAFPAANVVGVDYAKYWRGKADGDTAPTAADQGLTASKLRGARDILAARRKKGPLICVATEIDILNLATSLEVTSADYVNQKLLVDINKVLAEESDFFLGLKFKTIFPTEQVGHGTNAAECGLFVGDALQYRERTIVPLRHDRLQGRHFNHQFYEQIGAAFLRTDDSCVAQIIVNHTDTPVV